MKRSVFGYGSTPAVHDGPAISACFRKPAAVVLAVLLCAVALGGPGCSKAAPGDNPAPGTMRVISIEPRPEPEVPDLITNGDFAQWWAGAPVSEGFDAPKDGSSTIERSWNGEKWSARQEWSKADADAAPEDRFHVQVNNLVPNTAYRLVVTTAGATGSAISVSAYAPEKNGLTALKEDLIHVMPHVSDGMVKHFAADFQTQAEDTVVIASALTSQADPGTAVVWERWSLYPIDGATQ